MFDDDDEGFEYEKIERLDCQYYNGVNWNINGVYMWDFKWVRTQSMKGISKKIEGWGDGFSEKIGNLSGLGS